MKREYIRFFLSIAIYTGLFHLTEKLLVFPNILTDLTAFLPPLLGLLWGTFGVLGVAAGYLFAHLPDLSVKDWAATAFCAYFPYIMWHSVFIGEKEPIFDFSVKSLKKFIGIIFLTMLISSAFVGLSTSADDVARLFAYSNWKIETPLAYMGLLFLNDFDVTIFFAMPLFFILIGHGYPFVLPSEFVLKGRKSSERIYGTNRLALIWLYGFFLMLFVLLDTSGIIYDLDQMDIWLRFNGEILSLMNITLVILVYMLLKYRDSLMTNLMFLEMAAIFIAAFLLGSISFGAISAIIGENVDDGLQKMSVIYRERLVRAYNDVVMATGGIAHLAESEIESYARIRDDAAYRAHFMSMMERHLPVLAESAAGSIGCYMQLANDLGGEGFLYVRSQSNWGQKSMPFQRRTYEPYESRYQHGDEQNMAKLSEPYINKGSGEYMVSYVVPINKDGKYVGVVGIDLDFGYIIHEIKRMSIYERGYVRLLDKNGAVLYENRLPDVSYNKEQNFYETEAYLSNGVWLKISELTHDVYADRNRMMILLVVVALFIVIAVTLLSIWMAQKGLRPLRSIMEAAEKIAGGDLNVKLSYSAENELGILVHSIREMVAKLEIYVYHDELTGLLNTAAYARRMKELESRSGDNSEPYAVAVFDANFLKRINDTYGHEAGNELIVRAASLIARIFNRSPVYRIGGDEFVAILEGEDYKVRGRLLAEFDAELKHEYFMVGDKRVNVSIARGMAVSGPGIDFAVLFKEADAAMYQNKAEIKKRLGITGR